MKTGEGFILVYSIISQSSYDQAFKIHKSLVRIKESSDLPVILVANKIDLEEKRVVSVESGKTMAEQFRAKYKEASAKTGQGVTELFFDMVREINKWRSVHKPSSKRDGRRCTLL
jgi:GTPase SAR1 family protein